MGSAPLNAEAAAGQPARAGFVALIGAPNAGKSTLLNRLVGAKVSIVTHKVQTTRALVRGIAMHKRAQIVFVDTPGIFQPRRRLEKAMVSAAWSGAADADLVALLVDARKGLTDEVMAILEALAERRVPRILILNKIDVVRRDTLLALAAAANKAVPFERTFMVSALTGDGTAELVDFLAQAMPEGPWLYPPDQIADLPMRWLAAEITREKLMLRLHQELPYQTMVETGAWSETKDGGLRIEQTIYVARESQRKIVLGRNGATIRAISMAARKELSAMLERPVHLFLFVKVRADWTEDPQRYREMGLEFPR